MSRGSRMRMGNGNSDGDGTGHGGMHQGLWDALKQTRFPQLCIVVNNIKQLRLLILKLPLQLDWVQLEQRTGAIIDRQQIQHTLHNQLDSTISCLDHEVQEVVQTLATKVTACHWLALGPCLAQKWGGFTEGGLEPIMLLGWR